MYINWTAIAITIGFVFVLINNRKFRTILKKELEKKDEMREGK